MRPKVLKTITFLCLALLCPTPATGRGATVTPATADSLRRELARDVTARDSVRTLYHLFDISSRAEKVEIGMMLYRAAERSHDLKARLDMLRQLIQYNSRSDSARKELMDMAARLPRGKGVRGTRIFLKLQDISYTLLTMDEESRIRKIGELTEARRKPSASGNDLYTRIEDLGELVAYIGSAVQGKLYEEYLERYGTLIEKLPRWEYALRNQYYTMMANACTGLGEHAKGVAADRSLLRTIDEMEQDYHRRGRKFRDLDPARYVCYRRMLNNYPALSREEVNEIYAKILELGERNEDIASDLREHPRSKIYYLMANGHFREAIPLIRYELDEDKTLSMVQRRLNLLFLQQAARAVGDRELELEAMRGYCRVLETRDSLNSAQALQEYRIRYDVQQLEESSREMANRHSEEMLSTEKKRTLTILLGSLGVLAAVFLFIRYHWRSKKRERELTEELNYFRSLHLKRKRAEGDKPGS